ncbi:MAG: DUF3108 domain-containing protein [Nitrospirae bacterium]|nr:DUF3108 domain-containing protein [Nitrospirota bacterium]MCL5236437.1 DUF3108 domain-containing protein [Nitrospirota bacterium]
MKKIHKFLTPLVISFILSVILHVIFIFGISDINGFDFPDSFQDTVFLAHLVSEEPRALSLPKPAKKSPPTGLLRTNAGENHKAKEENNTPVEDEPAVHQEENKPVDSNETATDARDKAVVPDTPGTAGANNSPPSEPDAPAADREKTEPPSSLLKSSREKLRYDIYWLNIFVGRAVIEATNDKGTITITSQVHSTPFISTFYKVEDYAESTVVNGIPASFKIRQKEGKYRSDKETIFDSVNKRVTFSNHLKGTKDEHSVNQSVLWDVISGFYHLRTLSFDIGKTVYIDIFDSNKFLKAEVSILGKEKVTLFDKSEVDTVLVKPLLKSEGLFQNKGEILIWLTDDESKIPVRIETKVPIGTVVAELKSLELETEK